MSVSIVTPNFNNAPYVARFLENLMTDAAVSEIVIYDNGSTDGSPEMFEQLGAGKVRLLRGGANLGATLGRHEAVLAARNKFIFYLDGDDWVGPEAIHLSLESLQRDKSDIALLQVFEVDQAGKNPALFLDPPASPIDGRTAASMAMGGWRIHSWGVMRKSLYERAWDGFEPHGFLSDEVLTRRILLHAGKVGGCEGKVFYRRVPKSYSPQQLIDHGRTTVRSLALGVDNNLDAVAMRGQRRMTVRFMFGLARRALRGRMPAPAVADLLDEYFRIEQKWKLADAPWAAVDGLLRVIRPLLGRPAPRCGAQG